MRSLWRAAPEVYHKTIHLIDEHLYGVDASMDDIIVWESMKLNTTRD